MRLRIVDAFTEEPFGGNPAAVLMLDESPPSDWMAAVARETNLPNTAFVIRESPTDADLRLRWFTRGAVEIDLCGHATLAAAHCVFEDATGRAIRFATRSGVLTVNRRDDGPLAIDFPACPPAEIAPPDRLHEALGKPVGWTGLSANNYLLALAADERAIRELNPAIGRVAQLSADVVIVSAPADPTSPYDFVSRVFAPKVGIDEDHVTGSAYTVLTPYWADRLGQRALLGLQASARSGVVGVELTGDRVTITGRAVTVLDGDLRSAAQPN